eukprot:snap_masked-scaffold_13-processed-gene-10.43-mRNA-1 protein AED:1.00 eAED:1.00 QI:0/0/0/0/1/1/2/0/107
MTSLILIIFVNIISERISNLKKEIFKWAKPSLVVMHFCLKLVFGDLFEVFLRCAVSEVGPVVKVTCGEYIGIVANVRARIPSCFKKPKQYKNKEVRFHSTERTYLKS